jgi:hypothetical protein
VRNVGKIPPQKSDVLDWTAFAEDIGRTAA